MEGVKCEPMKLYMHYGVIILFLIPAMHDWVISPTIQRVTPATHAQIWSPVAQQWAWLSRKGQRSF